MTTIIYVYHKDMSPPSKVELMPNRCNMVYLQYGDTIKEWPSNVYLHGIESPTKGPIKLKIFVSNGNEHDKHIDVFDLKSPCSKIAISHDSYPLEHHRQARFANRLEKAFRKRNLLDGARLAEKCQPKPQAENVVELFDTSNYYYHIKNTKDPND